MTAAARPLVTVFTGNDSNTTVALPKVFLAPIRPDVVQTVHTSMAKNRRQAYAVSKWAGHQTSAESWGTGRAVARIPRVAGGGTHRSGQGAFGNMCRGGRMFAPTKTWRKWHRKINVNQRRVALTSAVAASAVPALVMARGHRVNQVASVPLVVDTAKIADISKTKQAVQLLKDIGAYKDVEHVISSKRVRRGKGKMRNRRYVQRRGPLVVYGNKSPMVKAFRNIAGVELCSVNRLNLLTLAPGSHMGRFVIWTKEAFESLDSVFGTFKGTSQQKKDFKLPQHKMLNADLTSIINSEAVQKVVRPAKESKRFHVHKKNPLVNPGFMVKLNPYAINQRRQGALASAGLINKTKKDAAKQKKQKAAIKKRRTAFYNRLTS